MPIQSSAIAARGKNDNMITEPRNTMTDTLKISDLHVSVEGKPILHGVALEMKRGETHALMGPNGSGKSTLGMAILGIRNTK